MPLAPNSWLEAIEDSPLRAYSLSDLLGQGIDLRQCLMDFHRAVFQAVRIERIQADSRDKVRLQSSIEQDHLLAQSAFGHLSGVLGGAAAGLDVATQDSLFNACQIVGQSRGIKIVRPTSPLRSEDMDDALNHIATASGFRTRQVKLKSGWWKENHGPFLGTLAESGLPVALVPDRRGQYQLHDPSTDSEVPADAAVVQKLDTKAYVFYRPFPEGPLTPWSLLWFGLAGCRKDLQLIMWLAIGSGLLATFVPIATGVPARFRNPKR